MVNISGASVDQPSGTATELLAVLSKSPMPAASKALALEYAAKNIRFNTISPAVVNRGLQVQPKQTVKVTLCPPDGVPHFRTDRIVIRSTGLSWSARANLLAKVISADAAKAHNIGQRVLI